MPQAQTSRRGCDTRTLASDVYIGMNALKRDAQSRTKEDIETIRHLYLDIDRNGPMALEAIGEFRPRAKAQLCP